MIAAADLTRRYGGASRPPAVDRVSLRLDRGEVMGIVGESGSGKTTLARLILGLETPDTGRVMLDGAALTPWTAASRSRIRAAAQMVFQDSGESLNPRLTALQTVAYGPMARGAARPGAEDAARAALDLVGLPPGRFAQAFPGQMSGGQRQRVNIARALALEPRALILDEPVSALDKSVEAQILNLLLDLRQRLGLAMLLISHDLAVIGYMADRIAVMQAGRIVETGPAEAILSAPQADYTRSLLSVAPRGTEAAR